MKIPILHLENGIHHFEQTIKMESLNFDRGDIYQGPLQLVAEINKFETNIQCKVGLATIANYHCDRCLEGYQRPVAIEFSFLIHVGRDQWQSGEDDVIHLPVETVEADISQQIIEQLILAVPMKMLCAEDCRGICPGCGVNLNESACQCREKPIDPRWEKLRGLLR